MSPETPFNVIATALGGAGSHSEGDQVKEGDAAAAAATADFVPVDSLRIDRTAIVKFKKVGDVSLLLHDIMCACMCVFVCIYTYIYVCVCLFLYKIFRLRYKIGLDKNVYDTIHFAAHYTDLHYSTPLDNNIENNTLLYRLYTI